MQPRFNHSPEAFNFDYKIWQFAIGLKNKDGEHFKDESIFKVTAQQVVKKRKYDEKLRKNIDVISKQQIQMVQCQVDNFDGKNTKKQFLELPYEKLYCFNRH